MRHGITREEARDMEQAHAEGLHDELPRSGCPTCDRRELSSYPTHETMLTREAARLERERRQERAELELIAEDEPRGEQPQDPRMYDVTTNWPLEDERP